jgi:hypothetical protein
LKLKTMKWEAASAMETGNQPLYYE